MNNKKFPKELFKKGFNCSRLCNLFKKEVKTIIKKGIIVMKKSSSEY